MNPPDVLTSLWAAINAASPRCHKDEDCSFPRAEDLRAAFDDRDKFRRTYAYAIPTPEVIDRIVAFAAGPIIEIGAGRALWARLIQDAGGSVRPTDIGASDRVMLGTNEYATLREGETWTPVQCLDAVIAAREATEPTLMTVWPAYDDPWANAALCAFRGERVVFVGESDGGCTADDAFFNELRAHYRLVDTLDIPQWYGLHDHVFLYEHV